MSREKILDELYKSGFVKHYIMQLSDNPLDRAYMEDIIQEVWIMLITTREGVLERLWDEGGLNQVRKYASGMISRQLHSKSSTIYRKYKRYILNTELIGEIKDGDYDTDSTRA